MINANIIPEYRYDVEIDIIDSDVTVVSGIREVLLTVDVALKIKHYSSFDVYNNSLNNNERDLFKIIIASGVSPGFRYLKTIRDIRMINENSYICVYSKNKTPLRCVYSDIDFYISLEKSVKVWERRLKNIINQDKNRRKKNVKSVLTHMEWFVLNEISMGKSMYKIAYNSNITYRRVSQLKNSAIRKLGLRNKTDLLIFLNS
ncbi:LuxR C-terminal-related transcriptional regulator [Klebsiella aerogenes]